MNEQVLGPLLFVGFIGIFILVAIAAKKADEARRKRIAEFCAHFGFQNLDVGLRGCGSPGSFFGSGGTPEASMLEALSSLRPFGTGDSRHFQFLLAKQIEGRWEYLSTYSYSTGSGKNRTTHTYDVLIWHLPHFWPELRIRPQGFLDNVGGLLGLRDIQFESDEFNKKMFVTSSDPQFAYSVLHPEAMEMVAAVIDEEWQFSGGFLVISLQSGTILDRYPQLSTQLQDFLDMVPAFVNQERQTGPVAMPMLPLQPRIES